MAQAREAGKMAEFAVFLRGINVGGHRKIPMADLRALLVGMPSVTTAQTYIASGNALIEAKGQANALAQEIAHAIKDMFGFDVPVLVVEGETLRATLADCPFPRDTGKLVHAFLCYGDPQLDVAAIGALQMPTEQVAAVGHTVWLYAPDGFGQSKLAAKMEKLIGVEATARNVNTLQKMVDMLKT